MLVTSLRERVRNGEFTERGLAKSVGVSQPHLHNILKGMRALTPEVGDQILTKLNLSILSLFDPGHMEHPLQLDSGNRTKFSAIDVLEGRIGPGEPWPTKVYTTRHFPISYARLAVMRHPVVARTARDVAMEPVFASDDLALLDQSPAAREEIHPDALYALKRGDSGIIRRLRLVADSIYIVAETQMYKPDGWERVSLVNLDILHLVRARVTFLPPEREWKS